MIPFGLWRRVLIDGKPFVIAELNCRHEVSFPETWLNASGCVVGRLQCTASPCRNIYDGLLLEGWAS